MTLEYLCQTCHEPLCSGTVQPLNSQRENRQRGVDLDNSLFFRPSAYCSSFPWSSTKPIQSTAALRYGRRDWTRGFVQAPLAHGLGSLAESLVRVLRLRLKWITPQKSIPKHSWESSSFVSKGPAMKQDGRTGQETRYRPYSRDEYGSATSQSIKIQRNQRLSGVHYRTPDRLTGNSGSITRKLDGQSERRSPRAGAIQ